jgi:hypothetical protein
MQFISTNADANAGPYLYLYRNSASPAANDVIGTISIRGNDSGGTLTNYCELDVLLDDVTDGSEDCTFRITQPVAGSVASRFKYANGLQLGFPTGGFKGNGTLNCFAVYDDSVLLCAPVEFMKSGTVNTAMWDEYAIDWHEPEHTWEKTLAEKVEITEDTLEERKDGPGFVKKQAQKTINRAIVDHVPVVDQDGNLVGTKEQERKVKMTSPAKTIKRRNELAHEFKAMLDEGFDPRDPKKYFDKMLADEALPGLKTKANWVPNEESNSKRTNRVILALELQTAAFKTVYEQVEALKAEVASLKKKVK